ncbi:uncharacterized protein LOC113213866 isoform X1 [Frankliniella occidentalis]|uniref:Uncharacterized protein LOC113213866 isoform X1 n=2 Tax=Frankliniella occidentalis TaxID=133901 RepID=A0A6J1TB22_FRAOC|nr:uncharacterized protein LOC113213866 isoform X1 [Frankliniella occidentalis]
MQAVRRRAVRIRTRRLPRPGAVVTVKPKLTFAATALLLGLAFGEFSLLILNYRQSTQKRADQAELRRIKEECMSSLGLTGDDVGRPGGKLSQDSTLAPKLYLCVLRGSGVFDDSGKFSMVNLKKRLSLNDYGGKSQKEIQLFIDAVRDECGARVESSEEPPENRAVILVKCISEHEQREMERQRTTRR